MKTFYFRDYNETDLSKRLELEIPEGYFRLGAGHVRVGDVHLNLLKIEDGQLEFLTITSDPVAGVDKNDKVTRNAVLSVVSHGVVLRAGSDDHSKYMCDRCKARPKHKKGYRYCYTCEDLIYKQLRRGRPSEDRV